MSIVQIGKNLGMRHNVSFRVLDACTGALVSEHTGHNAATNSLLTGIGHYLKGDGVLNQGYSMLNSYIPKYISLGTAGLLNQNEDADGLPAGIGTTDYSGMTYRELDGNQLDMIGATSSTALISEEHQEILRYCDYMTQSPGFGADGSDSNANNGRSHFGLGPVFADRPSVLTVGCELISDSFPRAPITFRDIVPETESELPETIDVVFSAMISTGALAQFREPQLDSDGNIQKDSDGNILKRPYVFITEAGLWSKPVWATDSSGHRKYDTGYNGLLAGYRITPPDEINWEMRPRTDDKTGVVATTPEQAAENRRILKHNILKVGINQVVQVVWKIQIGGLDQLTNMNYHYPEVEYKLKWREW